VRMIEVTLGIEFESDGDICAIRLLDAMRVLSRLRRGKFWRWVRELSVRSIASC